MKVLDINRIDFYPVIKVIFDQLNISPVALEAGVFKGKNAVAINELIDPEHLYLIDAYDPSWHTERSQKNAHRPWIEPVQKTSFYYGGDQTRQETHDNIMAEAQANLRPFDNVTFIRKQTNQSIAELTSHLNGKKIHFLYIDAGHDFDSVFDDLMFFSSLAATEHVIQLNDCCYSDFGMKRNFGVLEAALRFLKAQDYVPLGITNTDFSDLLICPRTSQIPTLFDSVISNSNARFCEIPDQLLGALRIKHNSSKQANLSFI